MEDEDEEEEGTKRRRRSKKEIVPLPHLYEPKCLCENLALTCLSFEKFTH